MRVTILNGDRRWRERFNISIRNVRDFGERRDELSYNNLLDFMNSSDFIAGIVSRCSSPILRESTGSVAPWSLFVVGVSEEEHGESWESGGVDWSRGKWWKISNADIQLEMAKLIKNNRILLIDNIFPHEEASMEVLLAKERILKLIQAWDENQIESWSLPALLLQLLNDSRTIDEMLKKREQAVNLLVQKKQEEQAAQIFTPNWDFLMINNDEEHSIQYKEYLENSSNAIATVLPTKEPDEYEVTFDDESECDVPIKDESYQVFTTFSNPIFDDNNDFTSSDDESLSNEYVPMEDFKVYSNSLFDDEEINSNEIDLHYFNAESNLIESLPNQDTLFDSSPKFDYLEEFSGELIPSSIIDEDIDVFTGTDDLMSSGSENDDYDSERDIQFLEELLGNDTPPIPKNESSNFDHHADPSFPRPPPEPSNIEIFFEPDWGVLTTNVVKGISEHYVLLPNILPTLPTFDLLYPMYDTLLPFSSENKDKVFKPGILSYLLVVIVPQPYRNLVPGFSCMMECKSSDIYLYESNIDDDFMKHYKLWILAVGDLAGLLYPNRLGICISPRQGIVAVMPSVISRWMVARVMAGVSDKALDDKLGYPLMIIYKDEYLTHLVPRGLVLLQVVVVAYDRFRKVSSVIFELSKLKSIPSEDPYEEAAQQLLEQAPLSLEYDEAPIEANIPEVASAPTPLLPPSFLSLRAPPLLPIPLHVPSTSHRAKIPKADTSPQKRLLHTAPRPGCEVRESFAATATRQPRPTMARNKDHAAVRAEIEVLRRERLAYEQEMLETQVRRYKWQHQTADDFVVQHIMRTQALEAGARIDKLEDTGSSS
nr:hypothetical protein [Tanacetum cinerariifolium]